MKNAALSALLLALPLAAHAAGNPQAGKALFATRCASCHSIGPSARGGFGPQLNAVFGRRAGTTSDYQYTQAMKTSGIVWSQETLSAFIKAPSKVVPGTRMRFWGMSDAQQIEDLLAYLQTFQ